MERDHLQEHPGYKSPCARSLRLVVVLALVLFVVAGVAVLGSTDPALADTEIIVDTISPSYPDGPPAPPTITAKAAILVDAATGEILFSHSANTRLPMASTTKIMTAVIALETLDLDEEVRVSATAASTYGSLFGLLSGERLTVEELLYALLVLSGNDAAIALAEACAGSTSAFVALMNEKAEELGLENTHFMNTNGLHAERHYSSAKDLATLATYAMQNPVFCRIVNTSEYVAIRPGPDGLPCDRLIENHNMLLHEYPWVTGVKTGSTPYAKYCLVFSGRQDGLSLIGVLLGAEDDETRWKEAKAILDYGYEASPRTVLAERGETVLTLDVLDSLGREVRLVSDRALVTRLFRDDQVVATARLTRDTTLPIRAGEPFGELTFNEGRMLLGSVGLVAAEPVEQFSIGMLMDEWQQMWPPGVALATRFTLGSPIVAGR